MWNLYIVGFSCLIFPRNLPYRTICICWVISIHQASQKDKICHKKICRHSCFPFWANANDWKQIMQEFGVLSSVALNLFSWFGILNCLNCFLCFFKHLHTRCLIARMPAAMFAQCLSVWSLFLGCSLNCLCLCIICRNLNFFFHLFKVAWISSWGICQYRRFFFLSFEVGGIKVKEFTSKFNKCWMFAVISKKEEFYPAQISGSFVRTREKNLVVELQAHQFTFQPQFEAQRKRSLWQVGWGAFWSKTWCLWRQHRTSHISYFESKKDFSRVLQGVFFCFLGGGFK